MRIGCDTCGAAYALADDKIQGRVFRIHCKKCGEPIMVWGWSRLSSPGRPALVDAAPEPAASLPSLIGARHENSGLFSLSSLGIARPEPPPTTAPPVDELLGIGTPGVVTPLSGLPLLTTVRRDRNRRRLTVVTVASVAILLTGMLGLLSEVVGRHEPTAAAASPRPKPAIGVRAARVERSSEPRAVVASAPAIPNARPEPREARVAPGDPQPRTARPSPPEAPRPAVRPAATEAPRSAAPSVSSPPSPAVAPVASAAAPAPARPANALEDLIDRAVPREEPAAPPEPAPVAAAPEPPRPTGPSREDVAAAMSAVAPTVSGCGQGTAGTAQVRVVFVPNGRATTATVVSQPFVGTATGSCIALAARQARVPAFTSASPFAVVYPFAVR